MSHFRTFLIVDFWNFRFSLISQYQKSISCFQFFCAATARPLLFHLSVYHFPSPIYLPYTPPIIASLLLSPLYFPSYLIILSYFLYIFIYDIRLTFISYVILMCDLQLLIYFTISSLNMSIPYVDNLKLLLFSSVPETYWKCHFQ